MTNHVKLICFSLLLLVELAVIFFYITPVLAVTSAGFPLDDSWIYAVFARNFVASGEIAFNLGHPSLGFTSSLWFLLLSLGRLWKFSPIGWSIFMGCTAQVMLAIISGLLVYRFLMTVEEVSHRSGRIIGKLDSEAGESVVSRPALDGDPPPGWAVRLLSFFASLLLLLCGPLVWYSLSGMETTCFMAIGLLAIYSLSRGWYRWAGIALGFLLITRIEGIALWGLAVAYAVIIEIRTAGEVFGRSGRMTDRLNPGEQAVEKNTCAFKIIKNLIPLILLPAIFLFLEVLKNLYFTGALLPTTFAGRRWLSVPAGGRGPVAYLKLWGYGFKLTLLPQFLQENPLLIFFWIGAGILALLSIRILLKEAVANKRRISGLSLFILWVIGHNLVYMVMLPSPSQAGRYQALNFLFFWLILFLPIASSLIRLTANPDRKRKIFSIAFLSVLLGGIFLLDLTSTVRWKEIYLGTVRHINDVHLIVASRVKDELPPGSRVAAFDIGALKYFSPGTEIIDLGGLVDREFAGYLREGRVVDYIKDRKAGYLAMVELQNSPGRIFENLKIQGDPRLKLKPLFGMMQRPEIYRLHYREAAITFPKMVLYEIEWKEKEVSKVP